jgi:hypothetical protein
MFVRRIKLHPTLEAKQAIVFDYSKLERLIKELYNQDIRILDTIPDERIGHYTYHHFDVDGDTELDIIGDAEVVKVWTETGNLTGIDMTNDPEWPDDDAIAWWEPTDGAVEVKHILHRLFKEGHIPAGTYYMLVDW